MPPRVTRDTIIRTDNGEEPFIGRLGDWLDTIQSDAIPFEPSEIEEMFADLSDSGIWLTHTGPGMFFLIRTMEVVAAMEGEPR